MSPFFRHVRVYLTDVLAVKSRQASAVVLHPVLGPGPQHETAAFVRHSEAVTSTQAHRPQEMSRECDLVFTTYRGQSEVFLGVCKILKCSLSDSNLLLNPRQVPFRFTSCHLL